MVVKLVGGGRGITTWKSKYILECIWVHGEGGGEWWFNPLSDMGGADSLRRPCVWEGGNKSRHFVRRYYLRVVYLYH